MRGSGGVSGAVAPSWQSLVCVTWPERRGFSRDRAGCQAGASRYGTDHRSLCAALRSSVAFPNGVLPCTEEPDEQKMRGEVDMEEKESHHHWWTERMRKQGSRQPSWPPGVAAPANPFV
ncbi:hypothetical protein ANANG_G00065600 [Anguilla anguilla]|uniref:Uncharacterized protein n=1 Tax=Anguilla anguilla TaxID=7936 RepID=A0A9D3MPP5_ANGAN|nr:hypothetical protein ANANG_G00065600 [Anguilla anguilla]